MEPKDSVFEQKSVLARKEALSILILMVVKCSRVQAARTCCTSRGHAPLARVFQQYYIHRSPIFGKLTGVLALRHFVDSWFVRRANDGNVGPIKINGVRVFSYKTVK